MSERGLLVSSGDAVDGLVIYDRVYPFAIGLIIK